MSRYPEHAPSLADCQEDDYIAECRAVVKERMEEVAEAAFDGDITEMDEDIVVMGLTYTVTVRRK